MPCCLQYLKSIRLERNRKTGFKCPRGCGKGTKHTGPCPGKIDKSHPIHPRNEEQKKKKKVSSAVGVHVMVWPWFCMFTHLIWTDAPGSCCKGMCIFWYGTEVSEYGPHFHICPG